MLIEQQTAQSTPSQQVCKHCKEPLEQEPILFADHAFCCNGCQMVYEILHGNELEAYYEMDQQAGRHQRHRAAVDYAFLAEPNIVDQLVDFQEANRLKLTFLLPDIHCSSCIWLLEHLDRLQAGIISTRVHFLKKTVSVYIDTSLTSVRQVAELLDQIGYPPKLSLAGKNETKTNPANRRMALQVGVAGFVFGNIMLLSFPDYLGLQESGFQELFGALNLLLIFPAVVFSAQDYWRSAFTALKHRHLNIDVPIVLGIITLFGRSAYEIISRTGAGYLDSLAGLILFLLIGKWFQQKTYYYLSFERDYKSYFPLAVTQLLSDGSQQQKALDELEEGNRILIRNQQIIPADAILVKGEALIDYSFVSGESESVLKQSGDKLFAGGRQMGGSIEVDIIRKVSQSYLTQLWNDAAFKKKEKGQASQLADRFGTWFTRIILSIAALTMTFWLFVDPSVAANATTAVLIIACPCAIALSIPFTFGNVLRILSRNGLFLKNTHAIEAIQTMDTMVFDKTGTLTSAQQAKVRFIGEPLSTEQVVLIKSMVHQSSHPVSRQISEMLGKQTIILPDNFQEFPGKGIQGTIQGQTIQIGSADFIYRTRLPKREEAIKQPKGTYVKIGQMTIGYFKVQQSLRKGLSTLLLRFNKQFRLFLLSGDRNREQAIFEPFFEKGHLQFNQSPGDKLSFIRQLQDAGHQVLMFGDGLNDAGALKQADVGLVITEDINNFTPSCDGILEAKHFEQLPKFLDFTRLSRRLIYWSYGLALIYNIIGLSYAVQGLLSPLIAAILMPLSSVTIIAFGVISSSVLAWSMGLKKDDSDHFAV
ncbi:MAG: heavy metal translocating P-type ATPase metal-binding domain-containing protein [Bacteroidota bacterium]